MPWGFGRWPAGLILLSISLGIVSKPSFAQVDHLEVQAKDPALDEAPAVPPEEQTQSAGGTNSKPAPICAPSHLGQCLKDIAKDQEAIWTSPLRIRSKDALWLAPFVGATALALAYDADAQNQLGLDKTRMDISSKISAFGSPWATIGEGAGVYFVAHLTHNDHLKETGRLSVEAIIDASLVAEGFKLATNRDRPNQGNGQGGFWPHGTRQYNLNSSFPSGHAAASWAMARVIASEYPNGWVRVSMYAFATAISVSRVTQRKHFPSDALVGSTFGYLIGGYVVRHHGHGSAQRSPSFAPIVDPYTHTFGMRFDFYPQDLHAMSPSKFVMGPRPHF
jgi:membrane-associated phospholipid phosphatase